MTLSLTRRLAAIGLSMIGLAAPWSPARAATTLHVTIAEYSSFTKPYYEQLAAAYEAAHPDIKVALEVVPWNSLLQRLTTDIAGGTAPDLSIIGTRWLLDFASQGVAEPLDGYLTPDLKSEFIDVFLAPSMIGGKTMGLPVAASARAMMVNLDLFDRAGVDAAQDLGRAARRGAEDRQAAGHVRLRFAGQGDRDRRLLRLRAVDLRRRHVHQGRQKRPTHARGDRSSRLLQEACRREAHPALADQLQPRGRVQLVQAGQAGHDLHLPHADPAGEGGSAQDALCGAAVPGQGGSGDLRRHRHADDVLLVEGEGRRLDVHAVLVSGRSGATSSTEARACCRS